MSLRVEPRRLVDGLDQHERLMRVELRMFGTARVTGLEAAVERLQDRVAELESIERRRAMGWFARLMLRIGGK
jgi:hypothetical protein